VQLYPDRLAAHLGKGPLAPVYLVAGEEPLIAGEACDAIRAAARREGYAEREVLFAERGFDWNQLRQAGASLSLFASRRVLEVRLPTGAPGAEGAAALAEYAARPADDTLLLVLSGAKPDRNAKWTKALEAAGVFVPVYPVDAARLPEWLAARLRARGLEPTPEAVRLLAERTEGHLLAAAQEVDKLALLAEGGRVDAEAVEHAVADSARFDPFQLLDATITGKPERALRMLAGLRAEGEPPVLLLSILAKEFRSLAALAAEVQAGSSIQRVVSRLWQMRQPAVTRALERGSVAFWRRAVQRAARVDQVVKGMRAGEPWDELTGLVAGVATARGRRAEAA
jgi:DNA polymerase-3 subunit delta